eukprot:TRINITY_DN94803_c0_g1_i1.p1 TRINITY_DN94803_c0_g1~~TRINITY_DN94803_c0_g1_i1.p1  ORF type:complete len:296 (+),score=23.15 TRINITY_DN94803_c0_g1_i1:39-926(+)
MKHAPIYQLIPATTHSPLEIPLQGYYLRHELHKRPKPFIYSNFITSLDGRVAIKKPVTDTQPQQTEMVAPPHLLNKRDWRLFQELAAQCDAAIVSGQYMRNWAAKKEPSIFQPKTFGDLQEWRQAAGLKPDIDLIVVSRTADFPLPTDKPHMNIIPVIPRSVPESRIKELEQASCVKQLVFCGDTSVSGVELREHVHNPGGVLSDYTILSSGGPEVMNLLLQARLVDRMYLTFANRVVGGEPDQFLTMVHGGPVIEQGMADFSLCGFALDPAAPLGVETEGKNRSSQLYLVYDLA